MRILAIAAAAAALAATSLAAQQTPQQAEAARRAAALRERAQRDSARADSLAPRLEYRREVFSYRGGTRDPFQSLVTSADVQIDVSDLRVVSIAYDPRGGNSGAVIREPTSQRVHRVRRGDMIGRLRVVQIRQYEVVFQIEEFGFERQEVLALTRPEANR